MQDAERDAWAKIEPRIDAGRDYHLAVSFGEDGLRVYLDGRLSAWNLSMTSGIENNPESLILGGNSWWRTAERPDKIYDHLNGTISEFAIYDAQLDQAGVSELAGLEPPVELTEPTVIDGVLYGTDGDDQLLGSQVQAGYGNDTVTGTSGDDRLDGGYGEDRLEAGAGNDVLVSRSDGGEPVIAQAYDSEDDPQGLVDPLTRTLYPDQPIEADDVLIGGEGS